MRVALAQVNSTLGAFEANAEKILENVVRAKESGCDLVVFGELTLFGYSPNDLLERESIVDAQLKVYKELLKKIPKGIGVAFGLITKNTKGGKRYFNSAAFVDDRGKVQLFHKELLPAYDVFDEARHIEKGGIANRVVSFKKKKILFTICEDIWGWSLKDHPSNYMQNPLKLVKGKVDLVVNLSASPFSDQKWRFRQIVTTATAKLFKSPIVYTNLVGAQDELIFDGGSLVMAPSGKVLACAKHFDEDLLIFDSEAKTKPKKYETRGRIESIHDALVVGLRDFCKKTGIPYIHLGLSGGIDSAVVLALAVKALGAENVTGLTLPGPFSAPESRELAEKLAVNFNVECLNFDIKPAYETIGKTLETELGQLEFGILHENIQARVRGLLLMAYTNHKNSLLLSTSNKSEGASGYATLYGDMCGGLMPIGDLVKADVYALAHWINRDSELIPQAIIDRAPTAELRAGQKDQDTLPPYDELDRAVKNLVEDCKPAKNEVERVTLQRLFRSEFKRWQAPPVLKVTPHAFGRGRRLPIAHQAKV